MFRKLALLVVAASMSFGLSASDAARVTPMVVDMTPTGRNATARIEVTNNENRDLPMEVRMYRGTIGERGELSLEPADERFVVFPPQVVMRANSQQVFRMQYIPEGQTDRSEIYYASVRQIPVALDPNVSQIQVVMRFNVLVNVVPEGSRAEPVISWVRPVRREIESRANFPDDTSRTTVEQGVEVRIENRGTRYFAAGRSGWTISGTSENGEAISDSRPVSRMSDAIGFGIVPPGQARIFFVPTESLLREEGATVTLGG